MGAGEFPPETWPGLVGTMSTAGTSLDRSRPAYSAANNWLKRRSSEWWEGKTRPLRAIGLSGMRPVPFCPFPRTWFQEKITNKGQINTIMLHSCRDSSILSNLHKHKEKMISLPHLQEDAARDGNGALLCSSKTLAQTWKKRKVWRGCAPMQLSQKHEVRVGRDREC